MSQVRIGVIGLGMMGRHHGRLCQSLDAFDFVGAVDPQGDQYGVIHQGQVFSDTESLLKQGIEAAVIAVPTHLHYETAMQLREAGIHVLIEKPLAGTTEEAAEIVEAFEGSGLIAAVGHVERCNPALNEMRQRLNKEQLGPVFSISTVRTGPFPARITDVGVVKDLATHDIDIVRWLAGEIHEIHSVTKHKMGRQHEDLMVAVGLAGDNVAVSMQVAWISPIKQRSVTVLGEKGALQADLLSSDLTFFENGHTSSEWEAIQQMRGVTEGNVTRYAFSKSEPIQIELLRFKEAITGGSDDDLVSLEDGLRTLQVAEDLIKENQ